MERRNRIAKWVYDTRSILGRFHLWLEDVEERWVQGGGEHSLSFVGGSLERAFKRVQIANLQLMLEVILLDWPVVTAN